MVNIHTKDVVKDKFNVFPIGSLMSDAINKLNQKELVEIARLLRDGAYPEVGKMLKISLMRVLIEESEDESGY